MTALAQRTPAGVGEPQALRAHEIRRMPVVVIALHEGCNCRCVMCDIWKIREPHELALETLERQLDSFEKLGVEWIALTGGEPQRHSHFAEFTTALHARGIRVTMLTAGVLLEADAKMVAGSVDDVIVSLDGPPEVHDRIRRIPSAFTKLESGIRALRAIRPNMGIGARCTVQRANHDALCRTVECGRAMGLNSISFLAADVTSYAFNRPVAWAAPRQNAVALAEQQIGRLQEEIESLIAMYGEDGFVAENPDKLRRIVLHFRAHLGQVPAVAPRCNAPWFSAVIEANGDVRPCFFHDCIGSIRQKTLAETINSPEARRFRTELNIATNPTCLRCVCSLDLPEAEKTGSARGSGGYTHEDTAGTVAGRNQELRGTEL